MNARKLSLLLFACSCIAVAAGWLFAFSYVGLVLMVMAALLLIAAIVAGRSWFGGVAMVVAVVWFFGAFPLALTAGFVLFDGGVDSSNAVQTPGPPRR